MGSRIALDADICLLREFDLVEICAGCDCANARIVLRVFEVDCLRLRAVRLGVGCEIKTMAVIMPGCELGTGTVVEALSVALEGSITGNQSIWSGNPMVSSGSSPNVDEAPANWYLMLSKIFMQSVLLYILFYTGQLPMTVILDSYPLPSQASFRYSFLLQWVMSYFVSGLLNALFCVCSKWIFVGAIKPAVCSKTTFTKVMHWAVDYMGRISSFTILQFVGDEHFNVWLALHGSDIHRKSSMVVWYVVPPSAADLFQLGAFSTISASYFIFEEKQGDSKQMSAIMIGEGCDVGLNCVVGPAVELAPSSAVGALTNVHHTTVLTKLYVFGDLVMEVSNIANNSATGRSSQDKTVCITAVFVRVVYIAALACCLVPGYELAMWLIYGTTDVRYDEKCVGIQRTVAIVSMSAPFVCTPIAWTVLGYIICSVVLSRAHTLISAGPRVPFLYVQTQMITYMSNSYLLELFKGSWWAAFYLEFMGSKLHTRDVYINTHRCLEFKLLHIKGRCVLDTDCYIIGHKFQHGSLHFGANVISPDSVLQPNAVTWAGSHTPTGAMLGANSHSLGDAVGMNDGRFLQGVPAEPIDHLIARDIPNC